MIMTPTRPVVDQDEPQQFDLFDRMLHRPGWQRFNEWVHTEQGGQVANRFIRLAIGVKRRGKKVGARAIWERIRWNYHMKKAEGETFRMNDHFHSYMARFAMERAPELKGFFELRQLGGKAR